MKHFATPTTCAWCGHVNSHATAVNGEDKPEPGNLSLCIECGEWSVFTETALRKPTDDEFVEIAADPDARRARAAWAQMDQTRRAEVTS